MTAADQVRLPRMSKGKRPAFFADPDMDQMMTFVLELMAEVSTLRDRLDTVERLLDKQGTLARDAVEAFQVDDKVEAERSSWRQGFIKRVLRMHPDRT
ncbi:MAG: hypothetical protein KGO02_18050 [Alphaproteobacteria bacterium]|nr:hypothetical protein [Alphaproteobacteria bacterium]